MEVVDVLVVEVVVLLEAERVLEVDVVLEMV